MGDGCQSIVATTNWYCSRPDSIQSLIRSATVPQQFRERGYRYDLIRSAWAGTSGSPLADQVLGPEPAIGTEFEVAILDGSLLRGLGRGLVDRRRLAEMAAKMMLNNAVEEALEELNDREQAVVRMRFGLDDGQPRTLEEVGREFGVTRERIRQIESKTLAKLRHPQHSQKLRDYLDGE